MKLIPISFLYTYNYREEEEDLCKLEVRALFSQPLNSFVLESNVNLDSSRSPFIKEKIEVLFKCDSLEELLVKVGEMPAPNTTFKVIGINYRDIEDLDEMRFNERKAISRQVASSIKGEGDIDEPDVIFAITKLKGMWYFGYYSKNEAIWLMHQQKPHNYSTALPTKVARAIVNIAAPKTGVKVIDPCCGIGTVIVEALSMGVDITGSDYNPLIMEGIQKNLEHFGLTTSITLRDIRDVKEMYDAVIIDMPYNICSVVSNTEKKEMLESARRFAKKMVIVTTEDIDSILNEVGFLIVDRCEVPKGNLIRQIIVCE